MSTEPTGITGSFKKMKRTNLNLSKKDWCSYIYKTECNENLDAYNHLCYYCKYRKLLDIPKMLEAKNGKLE